jgi:hypothetical protein
MRHEGKREPRGKWATPPTDTNEADWLDPGRGDQVFDKLGSVVDDSSLGLTLSDADGPGGSPPSRRVRASRRWAGPRR